jgi:NADH-quinone oxidoreductase subunit J
MSAALLSFYIFSSVILLSSLMVISTKNPVHSVLFLILTFFNAAGIFVILHAEFLAMILIIVYVGAVAVLFLFVVMMLDFKLSIDKENILQYTPIGLFIGLVFISELIIVLINTKLDLNNIQILANPISNYEGLTNTEALGSVLYTDYILYFQLSGVILLVAMIGSIVLTLRERDGVKRQSIQEQLDRNYQSSIELVDAKSNEGIDI